MSEVSQTARPAAASRGQESRPAEPGQEQSNRKGIEPYLRAMLKRGASDLHLSAKQQPRMRVDGVLAPLEGSGELPARALEKALLAAAPQRNREEFQRRNDTDFGLEIPGIARFRANYFRDRFGIGAVFRHIPTDILDFETLGIPEVLREVLGLSRGLVLVTGPTGSGKSTTLAAIIDLINRHRADHIITIEDPIEFVHPSKKCMVHQREVGIHTESFASALRASLREDPDIVLVGELRDLETTAIAIETAETGHLVFGTLHTTSAPSTIERIIDQFPQGQQAQIRTMLSGSLAYVVSQALLRKKEGGRVAAHEILVVNNAVANLIREDKVFQIPSIMQTAKGKGMQTLDDSLMKLVKDGVVDAEEALLKANDKTAFSGRVEALEADRKFSGGAGSPGPAVGGGGR